MKLFILWVAIVLAVALVWATAQASVTATVHLTYGEATLVTGPVFPGPVMIQAIYGDAWCAFDGYKQHAHSGFLFKRGIPFTVPAEHNTDGVYCTPDKDTYTDIRIVPPYAEGE